MIEIAFWGQNQTSFQKAKDIIKRALGINLSYVVIKDVTEFVGNLLFQNLFENATNI